MICGMTGGTNCGVSRMLSKAIALLALFTLAGCTTPTETEPTLLTSPSWRHWQPDIETASLDQSTDKSTPAAVASPKAVVLALHGFNDYSNAFQDFARFASGQGIAVHAYDQRGFGANPDRGRWPGMERLTGDLRDRITALRRVYGDTPFYVLGESMGGAVAIVAATDGEPFDIDGLILSAPAVWGGKHMNLFYRFTLWIASGVAPAWKLTGSGLNILPSDNIEMLRALGADPLVIKGTRTDAIAGLVALMDRALVKAPELDLDLLLLIGEKDEIVPPGALDDFRDRLTTEKASDIRYPDGYHMLLRDLQREKVFEDVTDWIDRQAPAENKAEALETPERTSHATLGR